jgi:hypothetical protein
MFVLCPHCHFLVGIDPRTGKPPPACPKCGGSVVEPLPEAHVEEVAAIAAPLDPFAQAELPSVAPTLPELPPAAEPAPEPIAAQPIAADPATTPPLAPPAPPIEPAPATVPAKSPLWPRRKPKAPATATPGPAASADVPEAEPARSDALLAADSIRRRTTRKAAEAPSATAAAAAGGPSPAVVPDAAATAAPVVAPVGASAHTATDLPGPAASEAGPEMRAADDMAPVGATATPTHPLRRRTDLDPGAASEPADGVVPSHPLRRRTDVVAPSFTRPRVRAAAPRIRWRSLAALAGLSLLLVLQLLLAQRDALAASARWRPVIGALCTTLRCTLPPWREPAAFTMLSREVRPHPDAPGTLLINASFRNDARWPQPWPALLLTLSDLDGRMVGARSFVAGEYLGAAPTQSELAPGQTAAVSLAVVEPAPNVVAFTFDFR